MIQLTKFLAMNSSEYRKSCDGRGGLCEFTETGQHIAEVGSKLPIIVKGNTCVGYAVIVEVDIKAHATTLVFKFRKVSADIGKGLYNYYQSSASEADDKYERRTAIPGVYQGNRTATSVDMGDADDDEFDPDTADFMNLGGFNYKPKKGR